MSSTWRPAGAPVLRVRAGQKVAVAWRPWQASDEFTGAAVRSTEETKMASKSLPARPARYTQTAIALHWLIALLIVCGFALGWVMTDIPGFTPTKLKYFSWHKWIGVTAFALAVVRVLWRATHASPALPGNTPAW